MTHAAHATAKPWDIPHAPVIGHAWEIENPTGVILLTHALAEYASRYYDRYNNLIPALNKAGYSVYAYDLRGHGDSPGDISLVDSYEQVQDHLAVRHALKARHPNLPFYLFAHSAGALFTAASVMADQSGIDGVVLSSPMLQAGQDQVALVRRIMPVASRFAPGLAIVPINSGGLSRIKDEVQAYNDDQRMYHGKVKLLTATTMMQLSADLWPKYRTWRVPTLVFYGSDDQVSYMGGLPEFVQNLGSADKTLHLFQGGYHELLNDLDRDAVLKLVLDWFEARKPKPSPLEEKLQAQRERLAKLRQARAAASA